MSGDKCTTTPSERVPSVSTDQPPKSALRDRDREALRDLGEALDVAAVRMARVVCETGASDSLKQFMQKQLVHEHALGSPILPEAVVRLGEEAGALGRCPCRARVQSEAEFGVKRIEHLGRSLPVKLTRIQVAIEEAADG